MGSPHIQMFGSFSTESGEVRDTLQGAGYEIELKADPASKKNSSSNLYVVKAGEAEASQICRDLRMGQGDGFVPILCLADEASTSSCLASLENGADICLRGPIRPQELLAQVKALLRIKGRHDELSARSAEFHRVNKRLQIAHQQMDLELDLARRLQESFLPQTLPELPQVTFAVVYRPKGRVGGDFYDVFRLDENHLAFYVADAMGHGVPASLLTIFVKKGVRAKEIQGQSYRLIPPDEVLMRLNHDLLEQALSEQPFITMAYVLYDHVERKLSFARAGHPYPLYIPRDGPATFWQIEGSLLGVFDTSYRLRTEQLSPGDKVILYTDGMDGATFVDSPVGTASLLEAADKYRNLSIGDFVYQLTTELFKNTGIADDLTVFAMEVR